MENLLEKSKPETQKPSMHEGTPFAFPPYRRSHLKSETFLTLTRILSHCVDESRSSSLLNALKPGICSDEATQTTQQELHDEYSLIDENDFITENSTEVIASEQRTGIEQNEELVCGDSLEPSTSSLQKDPIADAVVASVNDHYDHLGLAQTVVEESGQGAKDMENNEHYNCKILESVEGTQEQSYCLEQNVVEELEHAMQQKEMDLEKPDDSDTVVGSSVCLITDREMEEGEIPADIENQSIDFFLEDSVVFEERMVGKEQNPGDFIKQRQFTDNREQKGADEKDVASTSYLLGTVHSMNTCIQEELKEWKSEEKENKADMLGFCKTGKVKQVYGDYSVLEEGRNKMEGNGAKGDLNSPIAYFDSLGYPGEISEKTLTENQGITSTIKGSKVRDKKKRGPLTEERKAKKTITKRKKRAEKERQLGVKRLKLQPISKPKTVKYCEYYIKGRCQKGDLCKFSHDTIPLTKSKPCRFLALHSCLKGDDCPFDHDLSKYPCDKYMSKGCCSRGDNCMFSHKMPPMEGSSSASNFTQTSTASPSLPGSTNLRKPLNINTTSLQTLTNVSKGTTPRIPSSGGTVVNRDSEQNVAGMLKPPAQAPKGISFFSFGKPPLDDISKQQQGDLPSKRDDGVEICNRKKECASEKLQNSNEVPWRMPASPLSLCQSSNPLADGQNKNTPNSAQKALASTLAFAAKYESKMKMGRSTCSPALNVEANKASKYSSCFGSGSIQNGSMEVSALLKEFLLDAGGNNKQ